MPIFSVYARPSVRDVYFNFMVAKRNMQGRQRDVMRDLGRSWVEIARTEAPSRHGRFRSKIAFRTFERGYFVELRTYHPEPLGTWITKGTPPHLIHAVNRRFLKFLWEKGPSSNSRFTAYHWYKYVHHPGTTPNPYHVRATTKWRPQAAAALKQISEGFAIDLKGGL